MNLIKGIIILVVLILILKFVPKKKISISRICLIGVIGVCVYFLLEYLFKKRVIESWNNKNEGLYVCYISQDNNGPSHHLKLAYFPKPNGDESINTVNNQINNKYEDLTSINDFTEEGRRVKLVINAYYKGDQNNVDMFTESSKFKTLTYPLTLLSEDERRAAQNSNSKIPEKELDIEEFEKRLKMFIKDGRINIILISGNIEGSTNEEKNKFAEAFNILATNLGIAEIEGSVPSNNYYSVVYDNIRGKVANVAGVELGKNGGYYTTQPKQLFKKYDQMKFTGRNLMQNYYSNSGWEQVMKSLDLVAFTKYDKPIKNDISGYVNSARRAQNRWKQSIDGESGVYSSSNLQNVDLTITDKYLTHFYDSIECGYNNVIWMLNKGNAYYSNTLYWYKPNLKTDKEVMVQKSNENPNFIYCKPLKPNKVILIQAVNLSGGTVSEIKTPSDLVGYGHKIYVYDGDVLKEVGKFVHGGSNDVIKISNIISVDHSSVSEQILITYMHDIGRDGEVNNQYFMKVYNFSDNLCNVNSVAQNIMLPLDKKFRNVNTSVINGNELPQIIQGCIGQNESDIWIVTKEGKVYNTTTQGQSWREISRTFKTKTSESINNLCVINLSVTGDGVVLACVKEPNFLSTYSELTEITYLDSFPNPKEHFKVNNSKLVYNLSTTDLQISSSTLSDGNKINNVDIDSPKHSKIFVYSIDTNDWKQIGDSEIEQTKDGIKKLIACEPDSKGSGITNIFAIGYAGAIYRNIFTIPKYESPFFEDGMSMSNEKQIAKRYGGADYIILMNPGGKDENYQVLDYSLDSNRNSLIVKDNDTYSEKHYIPPTSRTPTFNEASTPEYVKINNYPKFKIEFASVSNNDPHVYIKTWPYLDSSLEISRERGENSAAGESNWYDAKNKCFSLNKHLCSKRELESKMSHGYKSYSCGWTNTNADQQQDQDTDSVKYWAGTSNPTPNKNKCVSSNGIWYGNELLSLAHENKSSNLSEAIASPYDRTNLNTELKGLGLINSEINEAEDEDLWRGAKRAYINAGCGWDPILGKDLNSCSTTNENGFSPDKNIADAYCCKYADKVNYLTVDNKGNLTLSNYGGSDNQKWIIERVESVDGKYEFIKIKHALTKKYLTVFQNNDDNLKVNNQVGLVREITSAPIDKNNPQIWGVIFGDLNIKEDFVGGKSTIETFTSVPQKDLFIKPNVAKDYIPDRNSYRLRYRTDYYKEDGSVGREAEKWNGRYYSNSVDPSWTRALYFFQPAIDGSAQYVPSANENTPEKSWKRDLSIRLNNDGTGYGWIFIGSGSNCEISVDGRSYNLGRNGTCLQQVGEGSSDIEQKRLVMKLKQMGGEATVTNKTISADVLKGVIWDSTKPPSQGGDIGNIIVTRIRSAPAGSALAAPTLNLEIKLLSIRDKDGVYNKNLQEHVWYKILTSGQVPSGTSQDVDQNGKIIWTKRHTNYYSTSDQDQAAPGGPTASYDSIGKIEKGKDNYVLDFLNKDFCGQGETTTGTNTSFNNSPVLFYDGLSNIDYPYNRVMDINKNVEGSPAEGYNVSYPEQCGYLYCDADPNCKGYTVSQDRIMVDGKVEPQYKCFPKASLDRQYVNTGDSYDKNTINNPGNFPRSVTKMGVASYIKKQSGWASMLDLDSRGSWIDTLNRKDESSTDNVNTYLSEGDKNKIKQVQTQCKNTGFTE